MLEFSVIIPVVGSLSSLAECLAAICNQKCNFDYEIIVVNRTGNDSSEYIQKNFPRVKLISLDSSCGIPEMRFAAISQSGGRYVAITEDHCIVPTDWLVKMHGAHQNGFEVVGGAVENKSCHRLMDWAVFLCEYSSFMPQVTNGETDFVTGNNTSYLRSALKQIDQKLLKDYWEYFIHAELKRHGAMFFSISSLIVNHKKRFGFIYYLKQRFYYSRSFAAMRSNQQNSSKNLLFLTYIPMLPFHQIAKIYLNVQRKKRNFKEFFLSLPLIFVFMLSYALGEAIGCLFGEEDSLSKVE